MRQAGLVPAAHPRQHDDGHQGHERKPCHPALPVRQHDKCSQQRPYRRSSVPANLKDRLRHAEAATGRKTRHARRLRMEDRRAHANQRRGQQQQGEARRNRQQQQTCQSEHHADRQGIGHGPVVGKVSDERLQNGGRHLERQRQQTDLTEVQMERSSSKWDRWRAAETAWCHSAGGKSSPLSAPEKLSRLSLGAGPWTSLFSTICVAMLDSCE